MKEWLTHFRSLLMAKYVAQPENILSMSVENVLRVKEQSAEITTELLNRGITDLTKTIAEARWSSQPRVLLEMCIVRLGAPQESEETFAFRNDAVRTSLQQSAAAEKDGHCADPQRFGRERPCVRRGTKVSGIRRTAGKTGAACSGEFV